MVSRGAAACVGVHTLFHSVPPRLDGKDGDCHSECWRVPWARDAIHRFLDRKLSHDGARFREARGSA
jgi:hypothetical protein